MKNALLFLGVVTVLLSCQTKQQYFEESAEIDTAKAIMKAYEEGNHDVYREHYSDTVKIYHNSVEAMSLDEMIKGEEEGAAIFSDFGFDESKTDYEMVVTNEGNTWVGVWGIWHGTLKEGGQEFKSPVHVSMKFVDGKVVEEWGYWDNAPIGEAMAANMSQPAAEADNMEAKEEGEGTQEEE